MPSRRYFFVYILTNHTRKVLYTGVTRDLEKRVAVHRLGTGARFTRRYGVDILVWFEVHENPVSAISREKQIKAGSRKRKIALIESKNPDWNDLGNAL
jgi:putative endonuclease